MTEYIQKPIFEENYLVRTLGQLVKRPDLDLTKLVVNAWDAIEERYEDISGQELAAKIGQQRFN